MADTDAYQEAVVKLMSYVDQTANFATAQLPDVAAQMLAYGETIAIIWAVVLGVFFLMSLFGFLLAVSKEDDIAMGLLFPLIITGIFLVVNIGTIIEIKTAPKLYILHELKNALK